jgi:hypothetical protein
MGSSVIAEPAVDQLRRALLDRVRAEREGVVTVPDAALLDLPERIVQFGTGALLRGFIDDFIHRANAAGKFGGRIVAIASTGSARDRALRRGGHRAGRARGAGADHQFREPRTLRGRPVGGRAGRRALTTDRVRVLEHDGGGHRRG